MKKFLLTAALIIGIVISQFVTISQAQTYTPQEGDKAIIDARGCHWCYESYNEAQIYRNKQLIAQDTAPEYGCSRSYNGDGRHAWSNESRRSYYIFTNGSWQQVIDY
ncbi:MAG: hypothetical protein IJL14_01710 [Selenomonadaceae bacterium]|nr:hypothetical protein [Selenomonadaceae bacterium]